MNQTLEQKTEENDPTYWTMTVFTNANPHGCMLITYKAKTNDQANRVGQNLLLTLSDVMKEFGKTRRDQVRDQLPRPTTREAYEAEIKANNCTEAEWDTAIQQYDNHKFG